MIFFNNNRPILLITLALTASFQAMAQEASNEQQEGNNISISQCNANKVYQPFLALETWATYNISGNNSTTENHDRLDISLRRLRFGASGQPYSWLKYSFHMHADRLGEDSYAHTKGSYGGIGIWNAYITAQLLPQSHLIYLHAGYYWAAISRQFNTSPWAVNSFDKTRAAWFLRSFVTGKSNGIESGIGLGGLKNFEKFGISYRVGTYEPNAYNNPENSDRLYTGRLMFTFGTPEQKTYKYMLSGNQWGKRNGVTIGLGGSSQHNGKLTDTTTWDNSMAYGADILINYKGLSIDGEYYLMKRNAQKAPDFEGNQHHVSVRYNIAVKQTFIEPSFTYEKYKGEGNKALFKQIGNDETFDVGINWYLNGQRIKISLHYVMQVVSISDPLGNYIGTALQIKL